MSFGPDHCRPEIALQNQLRSTGVHSSLNSGPPVDYRGGTQMKSQRHIVSALVLNIIACVCVLDGVVVTNATTVRQTGTGGTTNRFQSGDQYLVEFNGPSLPKDLSRQI